MLSTLEERVVNLKEFMWDMMQMLELVKGLTGTRVLNSTRNKLIERNDTLKAMVMALKEETMAMMMALSTIIEELEEELALCRAVVGVSCLQEWVEAMGQRELECGGFQELSKAMTVVEFIVKLGIGKDGLKSSNSKEKGQWWERP
ncbi:hypothetical protein J1N35_044337 [Gossypium stocksii]|uniref:Uncharacterized protein n=1 Tax=Gossypium stocksii TaxID=47602 RepID=A0A9D3U9A5_9ROSI|nr:hypothetical protein J1N35_044337 [Gossypium stocksii]